MQLPGRGLRTKEPFLTSPQEAAQQLLPIIASRLAQTPYIVSVPVISFVVDLTHPSIQNLAGIVPHTIFHKLSASFYFCRVACWPCLHQSLTAGGLSLLQHGSSQSQNVYFNSETSSLHWKCKLRNVWGQRFHMVEMF